MSQFSNCLSIGKESVLWVLANLLLQLLYHSLHGPLCPESSLAGFPIQCTSAAADAPGVCAPSHPFFGGSETVDFSLKSLIYGALGCVTSAILPSALLEAHIVLLATQNLSTVILWVCL